MPTDYTAIRRDHKADYGRKVGNYGKTFAEMYGQRAHFIHELLQNAEDALRTRGSSGPRSGVRFHLRGHTLEFRHYGRPFTDADVRSICAIGESTKDETAIGRFGIGFKSVFAFTDAPEVHSGQHAFRINDFVLPFRADPVERTDDETVFLLPLRDPSSVPEIERGLRALGPRVLLFLRHIDAIEWTAPGGASGTYVRETAHLNSYDSTQVKQVTILGESDHEQSIDEVWLIFSRPVSLGDGDSRFVEIAFSLEHERIVRVPRSPLVVFFPTVVETHLGFLVQGPYRTTTSRDSVLSQDPWNEQCVTETGQLLADSLQWLRDARRLNVEALRSLPIDRTKFDANNMFAPLYDLTKRTLLTTPLLPTSDDTYTPAANARIARTAPLRTLLTPNQLTRLFRSPHRQSWLTSEVSQDRTPELREYLRSDLDVPEVTPENFMRHVDLDFLEDQKNDWIRALYEFLLAIPGLRTRAMELPVIRLSNGEHVSVQSNSEPSAYLPSAVETDFPTVHPEVCSTKASMEFLTSLGLHAPDPIDDVLRHVLPRYSKDLDEIDGANYESDIARIVDAYDCDSRESRARLLKALESALFIVACDATTGEEFFCSADSVYLKSKRMSALFNGVDDVFFVSDQYSALRSPKAGRLLESCEVRPYLRTHDTPCKLPDWELQNVRRNAGLDAGWGAPPSDRTILGLDDLLQHLAGMSRKEREVRAHLLWESLGDLEQRNRDAFEITYSWSYSHKYRSEKIDAEFIRTLNRRPWVPDGSGKLRVPKEVSFESLGWKTNPFLQSKIPFKQPIIDRLATEAGIEPGALQLLRDLGIETEAELRARLGVLGTDDDGEGESEREGDGDAVDILRAGSSGARHEPNAIGEPFSARDGGVRGKPSGSSTDGKAAGHHQSSATESGRPGAGQRGSFVSYVAVDPEDGVATKDEVGESDRSARLRVEAKAIEIILTAEPDWHRTPPGNRGFDLFQTTDGSPTSEQVRWCEVKALSGHFDDRGVGISRAQFDFAREHGDACWLYVVEQVGEDDARILRIQDPAGKAQTFTFDRGWRQVAETEPSE